MAAITPYTVQSGRDTQHRDSYAQVGQCVFISNGHDDMLCHNLRNGVTSVYGVAKPGAAPTVATNGAGVLNGAYSWRVRWKDSKTGTFSQASASVSSSVAALNTMRVTRPGSPPSRATHWVLERTLSGQSSPYYPVNVDSTNPDGTVIATTFYDDNVSDDTLDSRAGEVLLNNQGIPSFVPRVLFSNQYILHGVGAAIHRVSVSLTNGSANVTVGSGFNSYMTGQDFSVPADKDGKTYKFTYASGTTGTLDSVYTGTTGTKTASIVDRRDRVWWAEGDNPEHGGDTFVGGVRNQQFLGDDGEPVVGGCALGPIGVLYCKESYLYFHRYNKAPNNAPTGDGVISKLQSRRGICGPNAVRFIQGYGYGIDRNGIWRASPGGEPQEIGWDIHSLWRDGSLAFGSGDNFHIGWDPAANWLIFFMCQTGETYPTKGYVWDLNQNKWRGPVKFPLGVTCTAELPDTTGCMRMVFWLEKGTGGLAAYHYFFGIGDSQGADPAYTRQIAATGGTTTTFTCAGGLKNVDGKFHGLQVRKRSASGTEELRIISSNDASSGTVAVAWAVPTANDTLIIGGIETSFKTGRLFCGEPTKKKLFKGVWLTIATSHNRDLFLQVYYNGNTTPEPNPQARNNDGVTQTVGNPVTKIACAGETQVRRVWVPLHGPAAKRYANDIVLELFSTDVTNGSTDTPWELMSMDLDWELESGDMPSRN